MLKKLSIALLLFCLPCVKAYSEGWYTEYWQRFFWKMNECGPIKLGTYVDIRTSNHFKNIRYLQVSEQLAYNVTKDFSLEIHYTYIHEKPLVPPTTPWEWQQRYELEANRNFNLPCNIKLATRNRIEIRKFEHNPKIQFRLRQRTMLVFPIKNCGKLKSFNILNEIFYNLSTHEFNQDRFCPFQLTFSLAKDVDLDLFFVLRFFLEADIWRKSYVFGTNLHF